MLFDKLINKKRSLESTESEICKKLTSDGYRWEKHEGTLYVMKNDNTFSVHMWDTSNPYIKRVYIAWRTQRDEIKKVGEEGLNFLQARVNYAFPHTTAVQLSEDTVMFRYETAVNNGNDFVKEFDKAYDILGESIGCYFDNLEKIGERYPKKVADDANGRIGFNTER